MSEETKKSSVVLVTSDSLARDLNLAESPQEAVNTEIKEDTSVNDEANIQSGEDEAISSKKNEEKKPNHKLEKRFSEITKQREAAREEARREREARESLELKLRELENSRKPEVRESINQEPDASQFSDMYEYAKALTDYRVEQKLREYKQNEEKAKIELAQKKKYESWVEKINETRKEIEDFDEMINSADVKVSNEVKETIIESEVGPKILYYLAENPEVAEKLQDMSLTSAIRMIGKIEAKFEKTEDAPKIEKAIKSKAPAPINPIKSGMTGTEQALVSDGKFTGSYNEYKAARRAGRLR